jgi:crotonobetainyl-CoA:carnitine CoA-transferase CaiB-like acyl-CoA transferase
MNTARQTWQTVDGTLQAAAAPRFSTTHWSAKPSPGRGEHTQDILDELSAQNRSAPSSG